MPSLSGSDYDTPDLSLSRVNARIYFLKSIQTLAPEVIRELKDDSLKLFQADLKERQAENKPLPLSILIEFANKSCAFSKSPDEQYSRCTRINQFSEGFYKELGDWARKYHIEEDWIFDHAIRNLDAWSEMQRQGDEEEGSLEWEKLPSWEGGVSSKKYVFNFEFHHKLSLLFERHDEKALKCNIKKDFNTKLNEFLKGISQDISATSLKGAPKKDSLRDFEWLAKYQCLNNITLARISGYQKPEGMLAATKRMEEKKKENAAKNMVRDAINHVANLIELRLRKKRGRPIKSR